MVCLRVCRGRGASAPADFRRLLFQHQSLQIRRVRRQRLRGADRVSAAVRGAQARAGRRNSPAVFPFGGGLGHGRVRGARGGVHHSVGRRVFRAHRRRRPPVRAGVHSGARGHARDRVPRAERGRVGGGRTADFRLAVRPAGRPEFLQNRPVRVLSAAEPEERRRLYLDHRQRGFLLGVPLPVPPRGGGGVHARRALGTPSVGLSHPAGHGRGHRGARRRSPDRVGLRHPDGTVSGRAPPACPLRKQAAFRQRGVAFGSKPR